MASRQSTIGFLLEQVAGAGDVSARRMFGEYGLSCAGKAVGVVCDDQLYLEPTAGGRALLYGDAKEASPYPGAKPHLLISRDLWDDAARLAALVRVTADELPVPAVRALRQTGSSRRAKRQPEGTRLGR